MTFINQKGVIQRGWYLLRTYVLTLKGFDSFLQGSLLILILLQSNVLLLLRRDHGGGQTPAYFEDWAIMTTGGAEFLLGTLLAWWGMGKRNFNLSAWLAIAALTGALVFFVPFETVPNADVGLCDSSPISLPLEPQVGWRGLRTAFLMIAAAVNALAQVSVWAHGLTYLDDHDPQNGPYFYGILISIRLSLGLSGQSWLQPASLREDWWKAHLSICCLTMMFAVLFTLFPAQMKEFSDDGDEATVAYTYFSSLGRIARNKALVLQITGLALLTTSIFGFAHYDRSYVQARFNMEAYRQDPQTSRAVSDIFRSLVIIFFVMIFRVRFSARRDEGVKANTAARVGGVVAIIVAIFLGVLAALGCNTGPVTGLDGQTYTQPQCSSQCTCNSYLYGFAPVCDLDTRQTYFSPCHAGCSEYEDLNGFFVFGNCTCSARAVRGACSINDCRTAFGAYQLIYTVVLAGGAAAFLMQGMVIIRSVRRADKPIAVGLSFSAIGLLSLVIGHFIYLMISYWTCTYHEDGTCAFHQETLFALCASSAALALCSGILSLLASRARTEPILTTIL